MSSQSTDSVQQPSAQPTPQPDAEQSRPLRRSGIKPWLGLATLVLPVLLISIDMTVLGFAVPYLSESLSPTGNQLLWIVDIYGFMIAGLLVTMGSLGDRIGRRRLLMIGSAAFGAASAVAAFSVSAEMLILARALLGVAGATLMPSTLSLIRHLFPDQRQRMIAVAVWASAFSAGAAFGPILGGLLLEHFFWGSVFLINLPVMALILVCVPLLISESRDPNPGRIDALSVLLSLAAMLLSVYGIKKLAEGDLAAVTWASLIIGLLAGALFVQRQRRLAHPLIDLSLFAVRRFRAAITANFMLVFAMVGSLFFLSQLLQLGYGMSPFDAGLALVPGLVISVLASFVVIPIAKRCSLRAVISTGIVIAMSGFLVLTQIPTTDGILLVLIAFALLGLGMGLAETLTNDAVLTAAPPQRAGAASAISETGYELGGALGVAVLGSVLTLGYRTGVQNAELDGVSGSAVEAASETLGTATATAQGLEPAAGDALLSAAQSAFVDGVQLTSAIAAGIMALAAITVFVLLRGDRGRASAPSQ